jgi:N,N'-diacetyllegionaminate synthase
VGVAETLAWDAYKTASPDIINRPLLEALAATGKPLIVSTGASTLDEVTRGVGWLARTRDRLAVLQCVSSYPAPAEALGGVGAIARATGLVTGYSDHTPGTGTGASAVGVGAAILEKHLTYDTRAQGPDHAASLDGAGMTSYVAALPDRVPPIAGVGEKRVLDCERDVREVSRQSLVATRDLTKGEVITPADLTIKRPGTGIEPFRMGEVVGAAVARPVEADLPLTPADLGW